MRSSAGASGRFSHYADTTFGYHARVCRLLTDSGPRQWAAAADRGRESGHRSPRFHRIAAGGDARLASGRKRCPARARRTCHGLERAGDAVAPRRVAPMGGSRRCRFLVGRADPGPSDIGVPRHGPGRQADSEKRSRWLATVDHSGGGLGQGCMGPAHREQASTTGRPYFLWRTDLSEASFLQRLNDPDLTVRAYWLGALLREGEHARRVAIHHTADHARHVAAGGAPPRSHAWDVGVAASDRSWG